MKKLHNEERWWTHEFVEIYTRVPIELFVSAFALKYHLKPDDIELEEVESYGGFTDRRLEIKYRHPTRLGDEDLPVLEYTPEMAA